MGPRPHRVCDLEVSEDLHVVIHLGLRDADPIKPHSLFGLEKSLGCQGAGVGDFLNQLRW